jgi:hypothetical protein
MIPEGAIHLAFIMPGPGLSACASLRRRLSQKVTRNVGHNSGLGDAMTEAEILSVRNEVTAIVVSVTGFSFTMISAYIAALWFFLKDAPFALRAITFVLLTFGLAFMGAMSAGLNDLLLATETAWGKLGKTATELPGFGNERPDFLTGFTLYEAAAALGAIVFVLIYLALFYLTFIYNWGDGLRRIYRG